MLEPTVRKYLERYAEPEARFAAQLEQPYGQTLIVPVHGEDPSFLHDLEPALSRAAERALVVAVVNATDDASDATHAANSHLLETLRGQLLLRQELEPLEGTPAAAELGRRSNHDLLLIDRASPGRRLPPDQGVGLARRIGADVALGLHGLGRLRSPWLACTDADARLPASYFPDIAAVAALAADGVRRVALTWPFLHVPGESAEVDAATADYELSLRYYTLGLASAGSPYAYESLGSTIVVLAQAYADVRGFPRRPAAEDFYLLDKLAKIGAIHRPAAEPVLLRSRLSGRVPFGTGARVSELVRARAGLETYHPRVFELLGVASQALRAAVVARNEARVAEELTLALAPLDVGAVSSALDELHTFEALRDTFDASPNASVRVRRLHTWLDALRTLRFIHLAEERAGLPRLPIREALELAPFCTFAQAKSSETALRSAAFSAEQALPSDIGVESAISSLVNAS
jgi:hypothetical protein